MRAERFAAPGRAYGPLMTVISSGRTAPSPSAAARPARPFVGELRLGAFASHRRTVIPLGPLTLLAGGSGSGKTTALRGYEALAQLAAGDPLEDVFPDPAAWVPERAGADAQGRRGFRLGCTVEGPAGPVSLDLAVQAEPVLRIVGERLTDDRETLLTTALLDPRRPFVQAAWHTAGAVPVTRAPSPTTGSARPCCRCGSRGRPTGSSGSWPPPSRWWSLCGRPSSAIRSRGGCARRSRSGKGA